MRVNTLLVYKYSSKKQGDIKRVIIMWRCMFVLAAIATSSVFGGVPQKILGGGAVKPYEFPFVASVRVNGYHICGGSIISTRHILTAAHCVANLNRLVHASLSVVTGTIFSESGGEIHSARISRYHGGYNASDASSPNDIAIIELDNPLKFHAGQNKIDIATSVVEDGAKATVIGWGYFDLSKLLVSRVLKKVTMETLGPGPCQIFLDTQLWTHQTCALSWPGQGTCFGDSGGPLVYENKLIGIISYGTPCAFGLPDVFTSTYHYRHWIKKNVAG